MRIQKSIIYTIIICSQACVYSYACVCVRVLSSLLFSCEHWERVFLCECLHKIMCM